MTDIKPAIRFQAPEYKKLKREFLDAVLQTVAEASAESRRGVVSEENSQTARGRADAAAKGVRCGGKPKLTPHQAREALKRRDQDGETLRSIARSYNVSAQTISKLAAAQHV